MKIISVIERPAVIRQIRSAELATKPGPFGTPHCNPQPPAPPDAPDSLADDHLRDWSYEPCFDDLPVPDPVMA